MKEILRCEDVRKSYGGVRVLQGVTLKVHAGEILGLVGANGAGKTTLIDIFGGQLQASTGEVWLASQRLAGKPSRRARCGLARTFQQPQVAMELSLWENVAVGLAVRQLSSVGRVLASAVTGMLSGSFAQREEVDAMCDRLALSGLDRLASEVSFGELRLVEVGRALVQRPRIVILDEPFPGVGDAGMAGIASALRVIKEEGCAVLLVDHNVDLLTSVVDRMALLAQGKVVVDADVPTCLASELFRTTYIGAA